MPANCRTGKLITTTESAMTLMYAHILSLSLLGDSPQLGHESLSPQELVAAQIDPLLSQIIPVSEAM